MIVADEGEAFTFPLSFAQERLWFLDRLQPGSSAYNIPLPLRLEGPLDVDALALALDAVVDRHESLRTSFLEVHGEPAQVVHESIHVPLETLDTTLVSPADREQEAKRLVTETALSPFDLTRPPLVRAHLIRLAEDDHVFLFTVHHIVADGWSTGIVLREIVELYRAHVEGREVALPALPIQYVDFASWQREWLAGERLAQQLSYWRGQLEGIPTVLDIPSDRPRPPVQSDRGAHLSTHLPRSLLERLRALGRREGATLFMTLLAALDTLLALYTGADDIVVGTPIANRIRVEVEQVVGFFANTVVLRTRTNGNLTFRELLARVRELTLDAYGHQDMPFEKLVAELNPQRELSHSPLFQVMFALQNAGQGQIALPGVTVTRMGFERGTSKFDLGFFAREVPEGLRIACEYSTDLFDEDRVERLLRELRTILESVSDDPDRRIADIDILAPEERASLESWNATAHAHEFSESLVHELVEAQVQRVPDAPAVEFGSETLTYGELNERANRLAHHLRELGVRPGSPVAISLPRSIDAVVAVLATLKAGGAYAPLDPTYPEERLRSMLEQARPPVVLTHEALRGRLPSHEGGVFCLDSSRAELERRPTTNPEPVKTPDDLAYVLFTSGSTGQPKGVAMPHRVLTNLLAWQLEAWTAPGPARTLQFASLGFDVAFQEIFSTWSAGGTLVLVTDDCRRDPSALLRLIDEAEVERIFVPFVALQHLAEASPDFGVFPRALREVITAGEALQSTPAIREFFSRGAGCVLHNHYGPTESHVVTEYTLRGDPIAWPPRPPIGTPIPNARIYLLDDRGARVPIGVPGELHIGGPVLARGYLDRDDLTRERFVPDPFVGGDGCMYRTGDRARYLSNGEIEYLGRADDQVKIRGHRVEPGEVESVLGGHDGLKDAVVVPRLDDNGSWRLVAYAVGADGACPSSAELREFLGSRLPDFMVPATFVVLDSLPLGATGKVDRLALQPPGRPRSEVETAEDAPPRDEVERRLVEIWQRAFGLDEPIGIREDFFALGGHSLLAVRVLALIHDALGVKVPLTSLFEATTVEEMAEKIRQLRGADEEWPILVPLKARGSRPPLFVLHGNDGELLHYREFVLNVDPEQPVYGIQPIGLDGRGRPSMRVEEMGERYADELCEFLPDGPYLLAGFCFSGVLAYEVAHQLSQRGRPALFVGLIDATPYGVGRQPTRIELERRKFADFLRLDGRGRRAWIARRARGVVVKLRLKIRLALYGLYERSGWKLPRFLHDVEGTLLKAVTGYVSPRSGISVTLFRAVADGVPNVLGNSAWPSLVEHVELHPIEAEGIRHDTIMREPYVRLLVSEMEACITRALGTDQGEAEAEVSSG